MHTTHELIVTRFLSTIFTRIAPDKRQGIPFTELRTFRSRRQTRLPTRVPTRKEHGADPCKKNEVPVTSTRIGSLHLKAVKRALSSSLQCLRTEATR